MSSDPHDVRVVHGLDDHVTVVDGRNASCRAVRRAGLVAIERLGAGDVVVVHVDACDERCGDVAGGTCSAAVSERTFERADVQLVAAVPEPDGGLVLTLRRPGDHDLPDWPW